MILYYAWCRSSDRGLRKAIRVSARDCAASLLEISSPQPVLPAFLARVLGSWPSASGNDASAPWSNKTLTQAPDPPAAAKCNGRSPASSVKLGSAPANNAARQTFAAP